MGRGIASRHQRFVKAEKTKVKLKGKKDAPKGKKDLPKGTNVTKTAFKVKKIVIREQVRNLVNNDQPLSKTKLNIKELLSRLEHFNTTARVDALNGLKDLITAIGNVTLTNSLGQLLKGVAPLVLDKEKNVRREAYKVLHMILSPLSLERIAPFFDALCSYLRCAMTHIDTRIHEDSLLYFDILLLCAPDLMGINVHKILPSFLDMISKLRVDSKPGRTLMVNLGSKMTSIKWRIKVLSRLHQLLQTLTNIRTNKKDQFQRNEISIRRSNDYALAYDANKLKCLPVYRGLTLTKLACFSKDKNIYSSGDNEGEKLQAYIEVLIPLLFETWLEVRPATNQDSKKVESVVSEEGILILRYILHIFYLLWSLGKLVEAEQRNSQLTNWFINKYHKDFAQYISNSFPYIQSAPKKRKKEEKALINLIEKVTDEKCLEENLIICHVFVIMNNNLISKAHSYSESEKVFSYLEWTVGRISKRNTVCQAKLLEVLQCILKSDGWTKSKKMDSLLNALITLYWTGEMQQSFKQHLFSLLCTILLNDNLSHLQANESFQAWLCELPNVICGSESISLESFNIINRLAIQNNKLFNDSIKNKIVLLIRNLPNIKIIEIPNEKIARMKLIGLLFWIKPWDADSLNVLQDQLESGVYEGEARRYLVDILEMSLNGIFKN